MSYPILEYDPTPEAIIEPAQQIKARDMPQACVLCFFGDVIEKVVDQHDAKVLVENRWEDGPHPIYEIDYQDQRLAFFHPGVGPAPAAGFLEEAIAYGCRTFIACGGCGVLQKDIALGHLLVVTAAVRDEGVSYHYLPPAHEVAADPQVASHLIDLLTARGIPHLPAKTWTMAAFYRETRPKAQKRAEEGCIAVEMEAAALIAVAKYRKVPFGQLLYAGDDLSGPEWDHRGWQTHAQIREQLFWLAADAALSL